MVPDKYLTYKYLSRTQREIIFTKNRLQASHSISKLVFLATYNVNMHQYVLEEEKADYKRCFALFLT